MEKPKINFNEISPGKLFQVNPEGRDAFQIMYGGEIIVGAEYDDMGVKGILYSMWNNKETPRQDGIAWIHAKWEYIECIGSVQWLKDLPISSSEES